MIWTTTTTRSTTDDIVKVLHDEIGYYSAGDGIRDKQGRYVGTTAAGNVYLFDGLPVFENDEAWRKIRKRFKPQVEVVVQIDNITHKFIFGSKGLNVFFVLDTFYYRIDKVPEKVTAEEIVVEDVILRYEGGTLSYFNSKAGVYLTTHSQAIVKKISLTVEP